MKENQINNTMLGRATEIEKCRDFDHLKASHKVKTYRWYKKSKECYCNCYNILLGL